MDSNNNQMRKNKMQSTTHELYVENPFDVKSKNHGTCEESTLVTFSYYDKIEGKRTQIRHTQVHNPPTLPYIRDQQLRDKR